MNSPTLLPTVLEASSIGLAADARLKESKGEGTVHGVFDGAVNVRLPGGIVSVVPEAAERGPLNVTFRMHGGEPKLASLGLRAGDRARARGATLELGSRVRIALGPAEVYSPGLRLDRSMVEDKEVSANLEAARSIGILAGNMKGLGGLLSLPRLGTAGPLNVFAAAALPRIAELERAFRSEDERLLRRAVGELIGLGPGLTPSSDDVLASLVLSCLVYSENRGSKREVSRLVARAAASEARGRTTILSEEYIGQAAQGRGNEPILRLISAVLTSGQESVERETRRVLAIGETSGTDAVLGVVLGMSLCLDLHPGMEGRGAA